MKKNKSNQKKRPFLFNFRHYYKSPFIYERDLFHIIIVIPNRSCHCRKDGHFHQQWWMNEIMENWFWDGPFHLSKKKKKKLNLLFNKKKFDLVLLKFFFYLVECIGLQCGMMKIFSLRIWNMKHSFSFFFFIFQSSKQKKMNDFDIILFERSPFD